MYIYFDFIINFISILEYSVSKYDAFNFEQTNLNMTAGDHDLPLNMPYSLNLTVSMTLAFSVLSNIDLYLSHLYPFLSVNLNLSGFTIELYEYFSE